MNTAVITMWWEDPLDEGLLLYLKIINALRMCGDRHLIYAPCPPAQSPHNATPGRHLSRSQPGRCVQLGAPPLGRRPPADL